MRFLRTAAALADAPEGVHVYDPVPNILTRRAGLERAQLLVQSRSRPALQAYVGAISARLFEQPPREVRWHLDVDPIEFD
jgi:primosomal protein N' (replication factor Y)